MLITYLHTLIYLNVYKFQKSHYLTLRMSFFKKGIKWYGLKPSICQACAVDEGVLREISG